MMLRQQQSEIFPMSGMRGKYDNVYRQTSGVISAVKIHGNGSVITQSRERLHTEKCANFS